MTIELHPARLVDAAGIAAIYRPVVEQTAISFELEPPSAEQMAERMSGRLDLHPWIVARDGDEILGYAYGTDFRSRPAYRFGTETSVYVAESQRGRGLGRRLMTSLLELVRRLRRSNVYAGVTLPNEASVTLHESLGFSPVAVFPRAGYKHGAWHDVGFWHLPLAEALPPAEPLTPEELTADDWAAAEVAPPEASGS
ncbi:MAG: N-acetyltransferase family protein [Acidobacteriota bacterium]